MNIKIPSLRKAKIRFYKHFKCAVIAITFAIFTNAIFSDTYVEGYYRKDGTYVKPHYRSDPNETQMDNWSTIGNANPHTGEIGTKIPNANKGYVGQPKASDDSIELFADYLSLRVQLGLNMVDDDSMPHRHPAPKLTRESVDRLKRFVEKLSNGKPKGSKNEDLYVLNTYEISEFFHYLSLVSKDDDLALYLKERIQNEFYTEPANSTSEESENLSLGLVIFAFGACVFAIIYQFRILF